MSSNADLLEAMQRMFAQSLPAGSGELNNIGQFLTMEHINMLTQNNDDDEDDSGGIDFDNIISRALDVSASLFSSAGRPDLFTDEQREASRVHANTVLSRDWMNEIFRDVAEPRQAEGRVILAGSRLFADLSRINSQWQRRQCEEAEVKDEAEVKEEAKEDAEKEVDVREECPLCMDSAVNVRIVGCKHEFCAGCLLQLQYYIKCPLCKQDFENVTELNR